MLKLEVSDLTKTHRLHSTDTLSQISFTAFGGEVIGIAGANGAGKTTLMRCLSGLLHPSSGSLSYVDNSVPLDLGSPPPLAAALQGMRLPSDLRVDKLLRLLCTMAGRGPTDPLTSALVGSLRLSPYLSERCGNLSEGAHQRVLLATSLIGEASILLWDEPFNGIDPESVPVLRDLILTLTSETRIIFLSSHQLQELEAICTKIILLRKGTIQLIAPSWLFSEPTSVLTCSHAQQATHLLANTQIDHVITPNTIYLRCALAELPASVRELSDSSPTQGAFSLSQLYQRYCTLDESKGPDGQQCLRE